MIFPFEGDGAFCAAVTGDGVLQVFDHRRRLAHVHFDFADVLGSVIGEAPFAGFLIDDECPLIGIGDVDEEGVVAFGDLKVANAEIGIGVEGGGSVGSAAPDGILRAVRGLNDAIGGEDFAFAAFDAGGGVGDGDLSPPMVASALAGGLADGFLGEPCWRGWWWQRKEVRHIR